MSNHSGHGFKQKNQSQIRLQKVVERKGSERIKLRSHQTPFWDQSGRPRRTWCRTHHNKYGASCHQHRRHHIGESLISPNLVMCFYLNSSTNFSRDEFIWGNLSKVEPYEFIIPNCTDRVIVTTNYLNQSPIYIFWKFVCHLSTCQQLKANLKELCMVELIFIK